MRKKLKIPPIVYFVIAFGLLYLGTRLQPIDSLQGQILVATEKLENDSNFTNGVILLLEDRKAQAVGLVLNGAAYGHPKVEGARWGGPVDSDVVHYLSHKKSKGAHKIPNTDLYVVFGRDIDPDSPPENAVKFYGGAGWDERQLNREMKRGMWNAVPALDAKTLLTMPQEGMYETFLERAESKED